MAKIFVVEDDPEISENVCDWLQVCESHIVESVDDGQEALEHLRFYQYDLIILDWDLPGKTGLQICNAFRSRGGNTPILFLTGKREMINKEAGLDAGADDYLTKPFNVRELAARVRALLRRPPGVIKGGKLVCRYVTIDVELGTVLANGEPVKLNTKEFGLLEFFMRHPGQAFTAQTLLDRLWQTDSAATVEAVTTVLSRLRKKLNRPGERSFITTRHGFGYCLDIDE